jgi:hypothetical protein
MIAFRGVVALSAYEELKGWQAGIGSVLGFFALMVAALWNFRLNRRRDTQLRTDEALSVAAALYGEMLLLRQEVAALARAVATAHINQGTQRYVALKIDQHLVEAHRLRATGSQDFVVNDIIVPRNYTSSLAEAPYHKEALFHSRMFFTFIFTLNAAHALGIARGAMDGFPKRRRGTRRPPQPHGYGTVHLSSPALVKLRQFLMLLAPTSLMRWGVLGRLHARAQLTPHRKLRKRASRLHIAFTRLPASSVCCFTGPAQMRFTLVTLWSAIFAISMLPSNIMRRSELTMSLPGRFCWDCVQAILAQIS